MNTAQGRLRSALGEHFVAGLIVVMVALAALACFPAIKSNTEGTAGRAQARVNVPIVEAYYLENGTYPSSKSTEQTSYRP